MDFKDQIKLLGDRVAKLRDSINTEEATKTSFVMPFLQALGYDIFNPTEVVPEYVCDIPTKKGEKIDYAIFEEGQPMILIECKHWKENLDVHDGQLLRYFTVSKARFGILTNGIIYRFYTDLESPNVMDSKPFLEIRIDDIKDQQLEELKKFHKSYFNLDNIISTASELKYTNALKVLIQQEVQDPSDDFTKLFARNVYQSNVTAKVLEYFKELLKKTFAQYISDAVNERLKSALSKQEQEEKQRAAEAPTPTPEAESKIVTTEEEMEGYFIVKAICRTKVDAGRVTYRDAQSYFSILLDDNNRKPICRLHFNGSKKFIGTFDANKSETRTEIKSLDDLYSFVPQLTAVLDAYASGKNSAQDAVE